MFTKKNKTTDYNKYVMLWVSHVFFTRPTQVLSVISFTTITCTNHVIRVFAVFTLLSILCKPKIRMLDIWLQNK